MGANVISDEQFSAEVLSYEPTVLVYFWADWCGPCKLVSPSIDWLAQDYAERLKVVKMSIDASPQAVKAYSVEGVPAIRMFRNGQLIHSSEGAITKGKLLELVDRNLSSPTEV
jgi:thioredoxin 1